MIHYIKEPSCFEPGASYGPYETICSHRWPVWNNEATRTWKYVGCPECLKLRSVVELGETAL